MDDMWKAVSEMYFLYLKYNVHLRIDATFETNLTKAIGGKPKVVVF